MADKETKTENTDHTVVIPPEAGLTDEEKQAMLDKANADAELAKIQQAKASENAALKASDPNAATALDPFGRLAPSAPPKKEKSLYDEIVEHLQAGRAVQHGGQVITDIKQIPSLAVLSKGDIKEQRNSLQVLLDRRASLDREIESLEAEIEAHEAAASDAKSKGK